MFRLLLKIIDYTHPITTTAQLWQECDIITIGMVRHFLVAMTLNNSAWQQRVDRAVIALLLGLALLSGARGGEFFPLDTVIQACQGLYGPPGGVAAQDWNRVLTVFQDGSEQAKLKELNDFINRKIRWDTDQNIWGQNDYWATTVESLIKGAGDCEDFAIAKYFSLKYLGVPVTKMRITYVKAKIGGAASTLTQAHMVLTYYPTPDADPLVLDNLVSEIRPASRRPDLVPIFSFNTDGVWAAGSTKPQQGGSRLSRWNDLLEKMQAEGFRQ